jgi:hypothetical protein
MDGAADNGVIQFRIIINQKVLVFRINLNQETSSVEILELSTSMPQIRV